MGWLSLYRAREACEVRCEATYPPVAVEVAVVRGVEASDAGDLAPIDGESGSWWRNLTF